MGEIKSAFEKAMEKVEKLGKASPEEIGRLEYIPQGQRLAGSYLREECDLASELGKFTEELKKWIIKGAQEVFLKNIDLPINEAVKYRNKRAMEGLKLIKRDKGRVENVFSKIRRIFEHYEVQGEPQRRQAYESLKSQFEAKLQQALQQQLGSQALRIRVDVESQPQFQEEWRKLLAQLNSQYYKVLDEYKEEITRIP